ncbi:hypothetical protein [Thalassobacillus hwangdonensis]|uniref:Intracellular proteinase inhibitor BsuPI domain-containing protein n=1 Tax=Thalassobacillus hwangdonensis TaxID=546108 RepID=A0ABW3L5C9_9BACI
MRMRLLIAILFIFALTGCIAEDYDVGVPTAHFKTDTHLDIGAQNVQLTEANIDWSSSSGEVDEKVADIEAFGLSQEEIEVFAEQEASIHFTPNKENGGDIWTDPVITAALWKNGEQIEIDLNESREFQLPQDLGNYVLEVTFTDESNTSQYVGNMVVQ